MYDPLVTTLDVSSAIVRRPVNWIFTVQKFVCLYCISTQPSSVGKSLVSVFLHKALSLNPVARCFTLSNKSISLQKHGCHTVLLYSSWGLTNVVYNCFSRGMSWYINDLRISPRIWLALLTVCSTWSENLCLLSFHTPRSFSTSTAYRT